MRHAAPVLLCLALGVSACGDDTGAAGPAEPSSTTTAPSPSSSSASVSASASPSASASAPAAAVAPTTGYVLSSPVISIRMPAAWTTRPLEDDRGGYGVGPDGRYQLSLATFKANGRDLDEDAVIALRTRKRDAPSTVREPNVVVAGQSAYHLSGPEFGLRQTEDYVFFYRNQQVQIRISTPLGVTPAARALLAQRVFASARLKG